MTITKISNARDEARKHQRCTVDAYDPYIDRGIFHKIIAKFGIENQTSMIMEECSELILAISHFRRKRVKSESIMEEVVDVTIMLEQARLIYDPNDVIFGKIYKRKIEKLEKLLRE